MLIKRLIVILLLAPVFIVLVTIGGWTYTIAVSITMAVAAWEFWRILSQGGFSPSLPLLVAGTGMLPLARGLQGFDYATLTLTVLILLAMTWHVIAFERGETGAAVDFLITLGGILYFGWLGSYFVLVRDLPSGLWWTLFVTFSIWMADAGAYLTGSLWGKHKMSQHVSPQKTWEGFAGGVFFGAVGTTLLAALWQAQIPGMVPISGLWMGLVFALVTPMGDMGESMIKRQFNVKDSSQLLPGHGGIMDRLDSWLWTVAIGYYLIVFLF